MNHLNLSADFPPVSVEAWEAVIHADLKGADYEKRLAWRTEEGVVVRPYYTRRDLEPFSEWIDTAPGQFPFVRGDGRPWQLVESEDAPCAHVRADDWHNQGATTVQELAFALAAGVEYLSAAKDPIEVIAPKVVFRFAIGSNFFFEIAKLRAARLLWSQVVTAFGSTLPEAAYLHIHAVTAVANKTLYDPHNNLLRASAEALSAVLGGCDWLTVIPFRFEERLARNVQHVLREESHLDRVADAGGGSYYLESLTHLLATEAWTLFQQIEAAGGFSAYRDSGALDLALAAARKARESAVSSRRRVIVGTTAYADSKERVTEGDADLDSWRVSGVFERLRLRTARHKERKGNAPRVLLLEGGDLKMRKARSGFCAAFFACAGLETFTSESLAAADLIVLCSADSEYLALAQNICPLASSPVLVAGNPKEDFEKLRALGVLGSIHLGTNAVATLSEWQDRLGMGA